MDLLWTLLLFPSTIADCIGSSAFDCGFDVTAIVAFRYINGSLLAGSMLVSFEYYCSFVLCLETSLSVCLSLGYHDRVCSLR